MPLDLKAMRARITVAALASVSNVAIAGAEPALFAANDPLHIRVAFDAVTYRSIGPTISLRKPSNGAAERTEADGSQTGVNRDVSWTATAAGNTAVVGAGMTLASEAKDLRIDLAAQDFGGDNEYVWAAAGHASGWIRDTELSLRDAARITVDPQIYPSSGDLADWTADRGALFHTQNGGNEFFDPPSSGDVENGQRVFPDVGFVGVRLLNARDEGLNGLTTTIKMWDAASIGSSEGSPAHTLSRVTETRRFGAPNTTPEAGWLPQEQTGVNREKLPLTWSTVLAGTWRVKSIVTAPTALVGIEAYPIVSGGSSWNRNLFLITSNPNFSAPIISLHPHDIAHHGTHLTRDDELVIFVYMIDNTTHKFVELVEANGDGVEVEVTREHHPTGRVDYFDFDTQTWIEKANGAAIGSSDTLIRASASPAHPGGDPDAWTNYPIYAGNIFLPDPAGELDFTVIATMTKDGVPYSQSASVAFVGEKNKHNTTRYLSVGETG